MPLRGPSAASARELDGVLSCGHFKSGAAIPDADLTSGRTVNVEFQYAGLEFSRGHLGALTCVDPDGETRGRDFVVPYHDARIRLEPILAVTHKLGAPRTDRDVVAVVFPDSPPKRPL